MMQNNKNTTTLEKVVHTEISTWRKLWKCFILHTFPLYIPVNMIPSPAGRAPSVTFLSNDHAAKQTKGNKLYWGWDHGTEVEARKWVGALSSGISNKHKHTKCQSVAMTVNAASTETCTMAECVIHTSVGHVSHITSCTISRLDTFSYRLE